MDEQDEETTTATEKSVTTTTGYLVFSENDLQVCCSQYFSYRKRCILTF